ncbi:hypothetical protein BESB_020710 [Besnoitia besnoiti]|uniref:Uncharacterized protein n=1 Tax=Besnoitia besnoiti TaxID=94643 RepID=A0A2A9M9S1_BESBE|nr:hypothetical protein BESB_020710 [Besnoitia besnoiti]PFH32130.1 hypothetical protein BESB_020710 [Besnoitia besnoiti]
MMYYDAVIARQRLSAADVQCVNAGVRVDALQQRLFRLEHKPIETLEEYVERRVEARAREAGLDTPFSHWYSDAQYDYARNAKKRDARRAKIRKRLLELTSRLPQNDGNPDSAGSGTSATKGSLGVGTSGSAHATTTSSGTHDTAAHAPTSEYVELSTGAGTTTVSGSTSPRRCARLISDGSNISDTLDTGTGNAIGASEALSAVVREVDLFSDEESLLWGPDGPFTDTERWLQALEVKIQGLEEEDPALLEAYTGQPDSSPDIPDGSQENGTWSSILTDAESSAEMDDSAIGSQCQDSLMSLQEPGRPEQRTRAGSISAVRQADDADAAVGGAPASHPQTAADPRCASHRRLLGESGAATGGLRACSDPKNTGEAGTPERRSLAPAPAVSEAPGEPVGTRPAADVSTQLEQRPRRKRSRRAHLEFLQQEVFMHNRVLQQLEKEGEETFIQYVTRYLAERAAREGHSVPTSASLCLAKYNYNKAKKRRKLSIAKTKKRLEERVKELTQLLESGAAVEGNADAT